MSLLDNLKARIKLRHLSVLFMAIFSMFILFEPLNMSAKEPFTLSRYIAVDPMQSRLRKFSDSHQFSVMQLLQSAYAGSVIVNAHTHFSAELLSSAGLISVLDETLPKICAPKLKTQAGYMPFAFFWYDPQAMGVAPNNDIASAKVVILYANPQASDMRDLFLMDCGDHLHIIPQPKI